MKPYRYYHTVGGAWESKVSWYSVLATDVQMVKDLIRSTHGLVGFSEWRVDKGCHITSKDGEAFIIP